MKIVFPCSVAYTRVTQNPPDCGLLGKTCCTLSTPSSTVRGCKGDGLYCPYEPASVCTQCSQADQEQNWECTHPFFPAAESG